MELHMVFFKSDYETIEEAMKNKDGLLVLALFYEVRYPNCKNKKLNV